MSLRLPLPAASASCTGTAWVVYVTPSITLLHTFLDKQVMAFQLGRSCKCGVTPTESDRPSIRLAALVLQQGHSACGHAHHDLWASCWRFVIPKHVPCTTAHISRKHGAAPLAGQGHGLMSSMPFTIEGLRSSQTGVLHEPMFGHVLNTPPARVALLSKGSSQHVAVTALQARTAGDLGLAWLPGQSPWSSVAEDVEADLRSGMSGLAGCACRPVLDACCSSQRRATCTC
jgi:hypothetical protein